MTFAEFMKEASMILGLDLESYKQKRVKRRTYSFLRKNDIKNLKECLQGLKNDSKVRENFINHVSINTSEFFRNPKSYQYLEKEVLPRLIKERGSLKIWSAACSNGSEPYTLAIILKEMNLSPRKFSILATDIDTDIIQKAKKGIYNKRAIRNVPDKVMDKYFSIKNNSYHLKKEIINLIDFKQQNLLVDKFPTQMDLILCRNFFIYLERDIKLALVKRLVDSLRKNGFLFLGNTEFIINPHQFNLKKTGSAFYLKE